LLIADSVFIFLCGDKDAMGLVSVTHFANLSRLLIVEKESTKRWLASGPEFVLVQPRSTNAPRYAT